MYHSQNYMGYVNLHPDQKEEEEEKEEEKG